MRDDSARAGDIRQLQHDTEYEVHMDTSAKVLGAVLLQKRATEVSFYPVAYFSQKLNNA